MCFCVFRDYLRRRMRRPCCGVSPQGCDSCASASPKRSSSSSHHGNEDSRDVDDKPVTSELPPLYHHHEYQNHISLPENQYSPSIPVHGNDAQQGAVIIIMDPLSIIASVAGTIDVGLRTTKTLYELIDNIVNGPVELAAIRRDSIAFYSILGSLERILAQRDQVKEDQAIVEVVQNLDAPLKNCMDTLQGLEILVQKNVKPSGELRKSRWRNFTAVFREKELRMLSERLVESKLTLDMALTAINTIRGASIHKSTNKIEALINHDISDQIAALRVDLRNIDSDKVNLASVRGVAGSEAGTDLGFALERFLDTTSVMDRPNSPESPDRLWADEGEKDFGQDMMSGETLVVAESRKRSSRSRSPSLRRPERVDYYPTDTSVYDGKWSVPEAYDPSVPTPLIEGLILEDTNSETTALNLAARHGNINLTLKLIEGGASIDEADERGYTPLHEACAQGREGIVKVLLDNDASTEAIDHQGMAPLHKAAMYPVESAELLTIASLLIAAKANVDARDDSGKTPLHYAAWQGRNSLVLLLMQHQADINAQDNVRWTPLQLAIHRSHNETATSLLSIDDRLNNQGPYSMTALMWAAETGNKRLIELLLSKGADPNLKDRHGNTALHFATSYGFVDIMKVLIEKNADIESVNDPHCRPLHVAAQYGQAEATRLLLDNCASPDAPGSRNWPPLHQAAGRGHTNVIKELVEHPSGADIEVRGEYHKTAIIWAAEVGQSRSIRELLAHKANVNAQDAFGESGLHYAAANGVFEVVRLLVSGGINVRMRNQRRMEPLHCAAAYHGGLYPAAKYLLDHGASTRTVDSDGMTPLHYAARSGCERIVTLFLERGVDTQVKDKEGRTPVELAQQKGQTEVVEILREWAKKGEE